MQTKKIWIKGKRRKANICYIVQVLLVLHIKEVFKIKRKPFKN